MQASQDRHGTILGMEEDYVDNTINPGEGVVADPNIDNTIYGDEYADYSNYEADQSYDEGAMAHQNMPGTLEGTQGNNNFNLYKHEIEKALFINYNSPFSIRKRK